MKIYNTLTRKKEDFVSLEPNKVKMYVCGPTVYDNIHIGNARPYIVFDTVRRYLQHKGYEVNYVQNFTDVDDKIINKANSQKVTMKDISQKYIAETLEDAKNLNIISPTNAPRVTEEMDIIIKMISELIEKGFAYEIKGAVYFNTLQFKEYGKLSHINKDDLENGARVEVDEDKQNLNDFVLWKPAKENEPSWESPWGNGRPGWHIECSAMAKKYLGETIDIHAGGEDLIFPHHENEIAQSEAVNDKTFANYWMHNGFINIDNRKMSKSKGDFFKLSDISAKYPYNVIRFFILSGHYRSPINFSDELLQSAENGFNRIEKCLIDLKTEIDILEQNSKIISNEEQIIIEKSKIFKIDFEKNMDDDFNTASAISSIFDYVKFVNINKDIILTFESKTKIYNEIVYLCEEILGIKMLNSLNQNIDNDEIEKINNLIKQRDEARKNKDWSTSDKIRDELNNLNVIVEDTKTEAGLRWYFKK